MLSIVMACAGILQIVYRDMSGEAPAAIFVIMGGAQTAIALIIFFIGAVLPKDGKYISKRMQKFLKVIMALAVLGGSPSSIAAYRLVNGEVKLQRFWEPALPLTWLIVDAGLMIFFSGTGVLKTVMIVSQISVLLLVISNLCWKVVEFKANDMFKWSMVLLPSIIIIGIFAIIFLITFIQDIRRGPTLNEELAENRAAINEALESYEEGSVENSGQLPYADLDMEGIIALVKADFDEDVYYRWVNGENDISSLVVWNDTSDDIYVYQFTKDGELYDLSSVFVSDAISKEDVEGKEDGVIPSGSGKSE